MNLKLSYLLAVTLGFSFFSVQAMEHAQAKLRMEQKYAQDGLQVQREHKAAATAQSAFQNTLNDINRLAQNAEISGNEQHKMRVSTYTAEFINAMQYAEYAIRLQSESSLDALKSAQKTLTNLMRQLPEHHDAYDTSLKNLMKESVYPGFKHIESELEACGKLLAGNDADKFEQVKSRVEHLNHFRVNFFALLQPWEKPLPEIHIVVHALLKILEKSEKAKIEDGKGGRVHNLISWMGKRTAYLKRAVLMWTKGGKQLPFGLNTLDWPLDQYDISQVIAHVTCIENLITIFLTEAGFNSEQIKHMRLQPLDKHNEFSAAVSILNECACAQRVPYRAAAIRQCLVNIDELVNIVNSSLLRKKGLRIVEHIIKGPLSLTQKEREIISNLALKPRIRLDYPITDDSALQKILDAVSQGAASVQRLMHHSVGQIEDYNRILAGLLLQSPKYKAFLENALNTYLKVKDAADAAHIFSNSLNACGLEASDIITLVHGLVDENGLVGSIVLSGLKSLNIPTLNLSLDKIKRNQAAINDVAQVLYHVFGFLNERGVHIGELILKHGSTLEDVLKDTKILAEEVEKRQFKLYVAQKFSIVAGTLDRGFKAIDAVAARGASTAQGFALTIRDLVEGLQIVFETNESLNQAVGMRFPTETTRTLINNSTTGHTHKPLPISDFDFARTNPIKSKLNSQIIPESLWNPISADQVRLAEEKHKAAEDAKLAGNIGLTLESLQELEKRENKKKEELIAESKVNAAAAEAQQQPISSDEEDEIERKRVMQDATPALAAEVKVSAAQAEEDNNRFAHSAADVGLGLEPMRAPDRQATPEVEAAAAERAMEPVHAESESIITKLKRERVALREACLATAQERRAKLSACDEVMVDLQEAEAKVETYQKKFESWPRLQRLYRWLKPCPYTAEVAALRARKEQLDGEINQLSAQTHKQRYLNNIMELFRAAESSRTTPLTEQEVQEYFDWAQWLQTQQSLKEQFDTLEAQKAALEAQKGNCQYEHLQKTWGWSPRKLFNRMRFAMSGSHEAELGRYDKQVSYIRKKQERLAAKRAEREQELNADAGVRRLRAGLTGKLAWLKALDPQAFDSLA